MKIKKCIMIVLIFFIVAAISPNEIFAKESSTNLKGTITTPSSTVPSLPPTASASAPGIENIKTGMAGVGNATTGGKISNILNAVIKLIQIAGSGIAVIVVTMLGVKYMLASSSEKADIKKQAVPIVVGCVILFAAVNLVAIVAGIGVSMNPPSTST